MLPSTYTGFSLEDRVCVSLIISSEGSFELEEAMPSKVSPDLCGVDNS